MKRTKPPKKIFSYTSIDLAIHQLIGFTHATQGYGIKSLIDSMGLTKQEWMEIKRNHNIDFLPEDTKEAIDICRGL